MEVEERLCYWLKGINTTLPLTSTYKIPCVCAPPQGADPCSNFKWLLRRERASPS